MYVFNYIYDDDHIYVFTAADRWHIYVGKDYPTDGRILVALYAQAASTHTLLLIHHMVGPTLLFPSVLLAPLVPHPFFPSLP